LYREYQPTSLVIQEFVNGMSIQAVNLPLNLFFTQNIPPSRKETKLNLSHINDCADTAVGIGVSAFPARLTKIDNSC
jgi:hypothetical protein